MYKKKIYCLIGIACNTYSKIYSFRGMIRHLIQSTNII